MWMARSAVLVMPAKLQSNCMGPGRLIGLDRDPDAVAVATQRLAPYPATVIHANYDEMAQVLQRLEIPAVDGILLDLGVSSHQLDTEELWLFLPYRCTIRYANESVGNVCCGRG